MRREALYSRKYLYKEFRETNALIVFGLLIISLGTYSIPWFYNRSKELYTINPEAPDPQRVATVLAILPFGWLIISKIIKNLVFTKIFGEIIEIVGWGLIIFLILKLFYDFTKAVEKLTGTNGKLWFLSLTLGLSGIILTILKFYQLSFLTAFLIIFIPAIQSELNSHFYRMKIKKDTNIFYGQ